jgi:hypothetical protein
VVKSGGDRQLDDAAAALSRSGEWERERMGARLGVWKRKKGGLAAGKARGRRRRAVLGGRAGGPDGEKQGRKRSR